MSDDFIPRWTTVTERTITENSFLRVLEHRRQEEGSGRIADFIIVDAPDWANICAITEGNQLVMIEQFRQGSSTIELEIPGGIVDAGELPEQTVVRELLEETGYVPSGTSELIKLGEVIPNPAFITNRCHFYCMTDVRLGGNTSFDEHESIRVRLVPRDKVPELVRSSEVRHSLVIAALYYLELSGR